MKFTALATTTGCTRLFATLAFAVTVTGVNSVPAGGIACCTRPDCRGACFAPTSGSDCGGTLFQCRVSDTEANIESCCANDCSQNDFCYLTFLGDNGNCPVATLQNCGDPVTCCESADECSNHDGDQACSFATETHCNSLGYTICPQTVSPPVIPQEPKGGGLVYTKRISCSGWGCENVPVSCYDSSVNDFLGVHRECDAYPCCQEENCGGLCHGLFSPTGGCADTGGFLCLPEQQKQVIGCCDLSCDSIGNLCHPVLGDNTDCASLRLAGQDYPHKCELVKCCAASDCTGCIAATEVDCNNRGPFEWTNCGAFPDSPNTTPKSGGIQGDPHVQRWDHKWFDFHGECDLVLLENPKFGIPEEFSNDGSANEALGLFIHVRTKIRAGFSFITSMVLKIGEDVLQVNSYGDYTLNYISNAEMPNIMEGIYLVYHEKLNEKEHTFRVLLGSNGEEIVIRTYKDILSVKFEQASFKDFGASRGLMGQFATGAMLARDGSTVLNDPLKFGNHWQVHNNETESLFMNSRKPQYPDKCIMPSDTQKQARRLGSGFAKEEAEKACEWWGSDHKDRCVFDCMAYGSLELAKLGP